MRLTVPLGLTALLLALPAPASAAFTKVWVRTSGDVVCIDSDSTLPVSYALRNPDGQTIESVAGSRPDTDDGACRGASATGSIGWAAPFESDYAPGAVVVASQAGVSLTFTLPTVVYRPNPAAPVPNTQDVHVRGLPGLAPFRFGPLQLVSDLNGNWDGQTQSGTTNLNSSYALRDSAGGTAAYDASIGPRRFRIRMAPGDDPRAFTVMGASPLNQPATVSLYAPDGTTLLDQTTVLPRVGSALGVDGALAALPRNGSIIKVDQPGWFASQIQAPTVAMTGDTFGVTVPVLPGETATVTPTLAFAPPTTVYCPGFGVLNLACTQTGFFIVPGDTVRVEATNAVGDSFAVTGTAPGSTGSLDDGSYFHYGGVSSARGRMTFSNPKHGAIDRYDEEDDAVGADADGFVDGSFFFYAHVVNGATVKPSGRAFGSSKPPTFTWNLQASVTGNTVSGTTYPNGRVSIVATRGALTDTVFPPVAADGSFSATLADIRAGDEIDVVAANPTTHDTTTAAIHAGEVHPVISGLSDGQYVHGTIKPTVTGTGFARVLWGGDMAGFNAGTAPFTWSFDTRQLDDLTYRVEATGLGTASTTDYLYVTVDNTKPDGSAGPAQTIAPGATATFVTGASDDTAGIKSVVMSFGDKKKATQRGDDATGIFHHTYPKAGTYTARVSITDYAGNSTSSTAKVHVTNDLPPAVRGGLPASVPKGRAASGQITAGAPGYLSVQLVGPSGQVLQRKVLHFAKSGSKATLSFETSKLAKGRYLTVWHFTGLDGWAGPVVTRNLRVR